MVPVLALREAKLPHTCILEIHEWPCTRFVHDPSIFMTCIRALTMYSAKYTQTKWCHCIDERLAANISDNIQRWSGIDHAIEKCHQQFSTLLFIRCEGILHLQHVLFLDRRKGRMARIIMVYKALMWRW